MLSPKMLTTTERVIHRFAESVGLQPGQVTELQWNMIVERASRARIIRKWNAERDVFSKAVKARKAHVKLLELDGHTPKQIAKLAGPEPIDPRTVDSPLRRAVLCQEEPSRNRIHDEHAVMFRVSRRPRTPSRLDACLQCKAKGLSCSLEWLGQDKAARCRRCVRNGCEHCIQQAESQERMLEHEGCRAGEEEADYTRQPDEAAIRMDSVVRARLPGSEGEVVLFVREPGVPAVELQKMAQELVSGNAVDFGGVLGQPLVLPDRKALALPLWHTNAREENRIKADFKCQEWRDFFREGHGWHEKHRRLVEQGAKMWEDGVNPLEADHQRLEEAARRLCGEEAQAAFAMDEADREARKDDDIQSNLAVNAVLDTGLKDQLAQDLASSPRGSETEEDVRDEFWDAEG